jgi:hypothetical protein
LWRCDVDIQQRRDLPGRLRACSDSSTPLRISS